MRRVLILAALTTPFLAGIGCKNVVTGRCDCTNDPANAVVPAPSNPYPVLSGSTAAPTAQTAPAPMEMPK